MTTSYRISWGDESVPVLRASLHRSRKDARGVQRSSFCAVRPRAANLSSVPARGCCSASGQVRLGIVPPRPDSTSSGSGLRCFHAERVHRRLRCRLPESERSWRPNLRSASVPALAHRVLCLRYSPFGQCIGFEPDALSKKRCFRTESAYTSTTVRQHRGNRLSAATSTARTRVPIRLLQPSSAPEPVPTQQSIRLRRRPHPVTNVDEDPGDTGPSEVL